MPHLPCDASRCKKIALAKTNDLAGTRDSCLPRPWAIFHVVGNLTHHVQAPHDAPLGGNVDRLLVLLLLDLFTNAGRAELAFEWSDRCNGRCAMTSTAVRHFFGGVVQIAEHAAFIIAGLALAVIGLGLGVTMIMLPVGIVVGLIGVLMIVGGFFARIDS